MGSRPLLLTIALSAFVASCSTGADSSTSASSVMPTESRSATVSETGQVPSTAEPAVASELRADPVTGELVSWILDHPDAVSLVVSDAGRSPSVRWNASSVRPIASTFKTIVLAAYAREVAAGRLDGDEVVPHDEIEHWLIEGSDGGSHAQMIEVFGSEEGVRIDDLAAAMMAFSSNTATDVLLERIGSSAIADTAVELGLPALAVVASPPAGAVALLSDPALGDGASERIEALVAMEPEEADAAAWSRAATFAGDPESVASDTLSAFGELTTWEQQLRFAEALPWRASPIELHALLVALLVDERLGELATSIIVRHMSWPLQDPEVAGRFERLAAKEGEAAGTLVATLVGRPTAGTRAGTDRIVVLTLHDMDLETWTSARDNWVYQALALRLAEDASFATELQAALEQ